MRKAISQTLALTLILSLAGTSFIAHAAVKAGSSFSKAGMSSVSGGKKFTNTRIRNFLNFDRRDFCCSLVAHQYVDSISQILD